MNTTRTVIELAKKSEAKMVDTLLTWRHFTLPIRELTEVLFSEGRGSDK